MTLTIAPTLSIKLYNVTKTIDGEVTTPSTSSIWFPTPPNLTSLPAAPAYTTNPELIPANSLVAPDWFDPETVDLEQLFNDLLPIDSPPVYPIELETNKLVAAQDEIVPVDLVVRSLFSAFYATYSLVPQITAVNLALKTVVKTLRWIQAQSESVALVGYAATLSKTYDPINRVGQFTTTGQAASFKLTPLKLKADPYLIKLDHAKTITKIGGEATILDALEQTDSIVAGANISINYTDYKFGVSSIEAGSASILGLVRRPNKTQIYLDQDFTVSFWFSPQQDIAQNSVSGLFQLSSTLGLCLYRPPLASDTFLAFGEFKSTGYIPSGDKYFTPLIVHGQTLVLDTFVHIVVESYNQQIRIYINGIQAGPTYSNFDIAFNQTDIFTVFGFGDFTDNSFTIDPDVTTTPGYLDDLVIDNFGRYAGQNFNVPTQPLASIEATKLLKRQILTADSGSISLGGQTASWILPDYSLVAAGATISLVGQISVLKKFNIIMPAQPGEISSTGYDTNEGPYFVSGSVVSTAFTGGVTPGFITRTFNPPSNYQLNDIMVFMAETSGDTTVFPTMTGWNLIAGGPVVDNPTSAGSKFYVWWRRISSAYEPSWSLPIEEHITASVFLVRNADPDESPIAAFAISSTSTASTSFSAPGLALNTPLTRVFVLAANPSDSSSTTRYSNLVNTSLTSLAEHFEYASSANNGGGLVAVSGKRLKSGVVNATTMTKNFSSTDTIITVAFKSKGVQVVEIVREISAAVGTYTVTGQSAALNKVILFSAAAGSYILTGLAADLNIQQGIAGLVGSFSAIGYPAILSAARLLSATSGALTLSGQNANFKVAVIMAANEGNFTLTGLAVTLVHNRVLTGNAANINLTGQDSALTYTPTIGTLEDQFELTALLEDDLLTLDF